MSVEQQKIRNSPVTRGVVLLLVLACMTILVLNGCSAQSRYRIKTVIFTGVPPLGQAPAEQEAEAAPQVANADQLEKQRRHRDAMVSKFWTHGPFAAGECERCHAVAQSTSFGAYADTTMAMAGPAGLSSASSRLSVKSSRLCTTCHGQHDRAAVRARRLNHHRPAATGRCMACHDPHQSLRQYMLRGADDIELCGQCHELPIPDPTHMDAQDQDCTSCHNAHVSAEPALLKSERSELRLLYDRYMR